MKLHIYAFDQCFVAIPPKVDSNIYEGGENRS